MNIIFEGWHGYCFIFHTRVKYKKIEEGFIADSFILMACVSQNRIQR